MLRIDLLRHLRQHPRTAGDSPVAPSSSFSSSEGKSTWKPILAVLLGFLLAGSAAFVWMNPGTWSRFVTPADTAPTRADSLRVALEEEASRLVLEQQSDAIEWLYELEALSPEGTKITRAVFLPPGEFQLRGTASTDAALSRIQESLVLLPGMDLRLSRSTPSEEGSGHGFHGFLFAGELRFTHTELPEPGNRVVSSGEADRALQEFLDAAAARGIGFEALDTGESAASAYLTARPWRVTFSCDPAALREFLNAERHRHSPFGIRRVTLIDNGDKEERLTAILDILAFVR